MECTASKVLLLIQGHSEYINTNSTLPADISSLQLQGISSLGRGIGNRGSGQWELRKFCLMVYLIRVSISIDEIKPPSWLASSI